NPAGHGFHHRAGDALVEACHREDVQPRQQLSHVAALAEQVETILKTRLVDLIEDRLHHRPASDPHEVDVRIQTLERLEHVGGRLLKVQPADRADDPRRWWYPHPPARVETAG